MQGLAKGQLLLDKGLKKEAAQVLLDCGELLSVQGAKVNSSELEAKRAESQMTWAEVRLRVVSFHGHT